MVKVAISYRSESLWCYGVSVGQLSPLITLHLLRCTCWAVQSGATICNAIGYSSAAILPGSRGETKYMQLRVIHSLDGVPTYARGSMPSPARYRSASQMEKARHGLEICARERGGGRERERESVCVK